MNVNEMMSDTMDAAAQTEHCKQSAKYEVLKNALDRAFAQASQGKGADRHAGAKAWLDQPMFWIAENFPSFTLGQAVKKIHESQGLSPDRAVRELQGAIIYIAAEINRIEDKGTLVINHN